jgi:hypothetical protein
MQLNLKIGNNLFLQGNKVISYETHVGDIDGGSIHARGKFSRTTGKHLSKAASFLGLRLIQSNDRPDFYKYEFGAKFYLDDCLSEAMSLHVISFLKANGMRYVGSHPPALEPMLFNAPNIGRKDWEILCRYFNFPPGTPTPQEEEKKTFKAINAMPWG